MALTTKIIDCFMLHHETRNNKALLASALCKHSAMAMEAAERAISSSSRDHKKNTHRISQQCQGEFAHYPLTGWD